MDEIQKSLKKLSAKERKIVEEIIERLISLNWLGLNIARLKGTPDIYRVRKGRLRIIFRHKDNQIDILTIDRRSEKTYRKYG